MNIQEIHEKLDQNEIVLVKHKTRNFVGIITKILYGDKVLSIPVKKLHRTYYPFGVEDHFENFEFVDLDYKDGDRKWQKTWIIRYNTYPNKPILLVEMNYDSDSGIIPADGYDPHPTVFRTDNFEPFNEVYHGYISKTDITILKVV